MEGCLEVLNVGAGDLKIEFDKDSDAEVKRAAEMIQAMMKQGYAILIEKEDGTHERVSSFDPKINCYIVGDRKKGRGKYRTAPVRKTRATAVARSAGG